MAELAENRGSEEENKTHKDVHLNWKKIALVGTIPILLIFIGFFAVLKFIGGENYSLAVEWFDERFGLTGIFLYVYVVDTLILPLSPDFVFPIVAIWFVIGLVAVYIAASIGY